MSTDEAAQRLVDYIKSRPSFVYYKCDEPYGHMGATVADSILQANNKYTTHVKPRVERILARWPDEKTVTELLNLLESVSPTDYLDWQGEDRACRFRDVLHLFKEEGVENESDLKVWLEKKVGDKTVDYFRIMVGLQGVAIDRRLLRFLAMAGTPISQSNYRAARDIVNRAADLASIPRRDFDHSIWRYMDDHEDKACA